MNSMRLFANCLNRHTLHRVLPALAIASLWLAPCSLSLIAEETGKAASGYRVELGTDDSDSPIYEIYRGERAIAIYQADLNGTPGFYPLLSPSGLPLTRNYPMQPSTWHNSNADVAVRFERQDHPHHRSMWFNHGDVNGLDFWAAIPAEEMGHIVQRSGGVEVDSASSSINGVVTKNESCTLATGNDWITPDGKRLLQDERTFVFHEHLGDTVMDITIRLIAGETPVTFGDTKEGSLGIRTAGTMKVDAKLGGEIHNAEGLKDREAWSKRSDWVDYSGPIAPADLPEAKGKDNVTAKDAEDWKRAGITMMYHPENSIPDCRWHVRTYGLFAANPFGHKHFGLPAYDGYRIESGQSLTLHFRVVLHDGGFDADKAQDHFKAYAAESIKP